MKLNQVCTLNSKITDLILSLESNRKVLTLIGVPEQLKLNLRRQSLLHSAIYSARIENNSLTPKTFAGSPKSIKHLEIQNILDTLNWIYSQETKLDLSLNVLRQLHARLMHNLHEEAGHFRTVASAVFNSAGVALYLAPPAIEVIPLIESHLTQFATSTIPVPVKIALAHYQFEKIHPFLDGNGRMGRLLTTILLKNHGLDLHGVASLEEYIDSHRDDYYTLLGENQRDITHFVEYFLTAISSMQEQALSSLKSANATIPILFPRQQELLETVRNHSLCTFDFMRRRFYGIPTSTLHYDLQQLQKNKLIYKIGTTRGALYSASPVE